MKQKASPGLWRIVLVSAVMIASTAGCETVQSVQTALTPSSQPAGTAVPSVQECAVFNISTPTRYACNGKVYTSYQLAKIRAEEDKKYLSGK